MGCMVTARSPLRLVGDRDGGPPAHTNDYDERWFLHTAESSWERAGQVGKLRSEPQGDTQPGFRRPSRMGRGARPTARCRTGRSTWPSACIAAPRRKVRLRSRRLSVESAELAAGGGSATGAGQSLRGPAEWETLSAPRKCRLRAFSALLGQPGCRKPPGTSLRVSAQAARGSGAPGLGSRGPARPPQSQPSSTASPSDGSPTLHFRPASQALGPQRAG
jgi:hypothetical protein